VPSPSGLRFRAWGKCKKAYCYAGGKKMTIFGVGNNPASKFILLYVKEREVGNHTEGSDVSELKNNRKFE